MANDGIYFQRGTPLRCWLMAMPAGANQAQYNADCRASVRWATEAEVRAEYGMSREEWIRRWQTEKPKGGGKAA